MIRMEPPVGPLWAHEVKFDGWRVQIHKRGDQIRIYSKRGHDFSDRFPNIGFAARNIPAETAVIDGELIACDSDGLPDFTALLQRDLRTLCVWCFDVLAVDDMDLRELPCAERRTRLSRLLSRTDDLRLRYSEQFDDPHALLKVCAKMRMEGVVSKRIDRPYTSGPTKNWIKVKCRTWREENTWRYDYFKKRK
jgi:bifunctional non-homologous end joining protein LigD